jgi:ubiquinone/menaquinone biosynthesis C-methylase UbiE
MKKITSAEKYFRRYLKIAPLSVALCRSIEASFFSTVRMKAPILDIGCGFGEFAKVFFDSQIAMGVDNSALDLLAAAKVKKYKHLLLADARKLPLANNSFATVMSVSTMEHIPEVEKVIHEAYRVLKPKGMLAISMETNEVDTHMFYWQLLEKMGLHTLAGMYKKAFNDLFHRHTLFSQKEWEHIIKKSGFVIEKSHMIVSPTIITLFDIFTVTAWLSQILRPFIGRRVVYRPQVMINFLTFLFMRYINAKDTRGTVLFLVARKT